MDEVKDGTVNPLNDAPGEGVENQDSVPATETPEEKIARLEASNKKLFERTKKAEELVKKSKSSTPPPVQTQKPDSEASDPIYVANLANVLKDLSPEEIEFAKTVAKGSDVSLLQAIQSSGFQAFHMSESEKRKKEAAKVGGSRGSGEAAEEALVKPNSTREEHMDIWKKVSGK